jgi:hypothetical protein
MLKLGSIFLILFVVIQLNSIRGGRIIAKRSLFDFDEAGNTESTSEPPPAVVNLINNEASSQNSTEINGTLNEVSLQQSSSSILSQNALQLNTNNSLVQQAFILIAGSVIPQLQQEFQQLDHFNTFLSNFIKNMTTTVAALSKNEDDDDSNSKCQDVFKKLISNCGQELLQKFAILLMQDSDNDNN